MNVKKAIKRIVALGSGLTMIGATIMGASALSLDDYPSPFVNNGVFDGKIVIGANANPADVLGAIDISASLQAAATTMVSTSGTGANVVVPGGIQLDGGSGDYLIYAENANGQDNLDDDDLALVLATGNVKDDDGETRTGADLAEDDSDYDQEISIGSFDVAFSLAGKEDNPSVNIEPAGVAYSLVVDFDNKMDFVAMNDGETIEIAGKTFTVGTDTDIDTLILFGSDTTTYLELNSPVMIDTAGESYSIEIVGADSDGSDNTVIIDVDGVRKTMEEGDTTTVNGLDVYIKDLFVTNIPTLSASANIFVGSEEYLLETGKTIKVNDEKLEGYKFTLTGTNMSTVEKFTFAFTPSDLDDDDGFDDEDKYLKAGEVMVDPLFDTFKLDFASMSQDLMDTAKVPFNIDASGDEATVTFTNYDGDEVTFDAYNVDVSTSKFYNNSGDEFAVGVSTLSEDHYFLCNDGTTGDIVTSLFVVDDIDLADNETTIVNLMTGAEKVYDLLDKIDDCELSIATIGATTIGLSGGNTGSAIVLEGGTTATFTTTSVVLQEVIPSGEDVATAGNVTITMGVDSDKDYEMTDADTAFVELNNDADDTEALSAYGSYYTLDEDGLDFLAYFPNEEEVEYNVFFAPVASKAVVPGGQDGDAYVVNPIAVGIAVLDVDAPAVGSTPMIVVGGPCANSVASELMGNPAVCGEGFEMGKGIIKYFDDNQAILVAGYEAVETQGASRVLADYEDYSELTGTEVSVIVPTLSSISVESTN